MPLTPVRILSICWALAGTQRVAFRTTVGETDAVEITGNDVMAVGVGSGFCNDPNTSAAAEKHMRIKQPAIIIPTKRRNGDFFLTTGDCAFILFSFLWKAFTGETVIIISIEAVNIADALSYAIVVAGLRT